MRFLMLALTVALAACDPPATTTTAAPAAATPAADTPSTRWDARLVGMMPFIDACIARSPDTRVVTYAAPTGEALITVRLDGSPGAVDCNVPDHDPAPTYAVISPRRDDFSPDGDGAALFVRARPGETQNPGGECYEAPEVRGANNELLGWMLDPEGC